MLMTTHASTLQPTPANTGRQAALTASIASIIMFFAALIAELYMRQHLIVPGDAAATASAVLAHTGVFRLGLCCFLLVLVCDVLVAWALYLFFNPLHGPLSLLGMLFRLVYTAMFGTALFNLVAGFRMLTSPAGFSSGLLQSQALQCFQGFDDAWALALVFFGIHLLLVARLIFKASVVPKWLGYVLLIAGVAYLSDNLCKLLLPSYAAWKVVLTTLVAIPSMVGELGFAIWLLMKGGKENR